MPIDYHHLMNRPFAPVRHAYGRRDTILYALGVGLGGDPTDRGQLRYVYEHGLAALPTMACILGYPGFWADQPDTGIDWRRLVHAEQSFTLHRPLAPEGRIVGHNRVSALYDKGAKGALLCQERQVTDEDSGEAIATVNQVSLLRGDGNFGGPAGAPPPPVPVPDRAPDLVCDLATLPQAALLYRQSGDLNPLHADPDVAAAAGFPRPILHGMCAMGVAFHAVLRAALAYDSGPVRGMRVRFTAPVLPGETIRTEMWREGSVIAFRSRAADRDAVVLDAGQVFLI